VNITFYLVVANQTHASSLTDENFCHCNVQWIGVLQANVPILSCSQQTRVSGQHCSAKAQAKTQLELLIEEVENLQNTIQSSEHDPDSMFFLLLRAGIVETVQRVKAAQAKELLPVNEPTPFVARDDGHGFSLKRLRPYHEIGGGKGNPHPKRSAVSHQENSQPLAEPFSQPPASNRPQTMMEQLDASSSRAKRQKVTSLQTLKHAGSALPSDSHGPLQFVNPAPSVQVQAFQPALDCCNPSISPSQEWMHPSTSSHKHVGGPHANKDQLQPADPKPLSQPRALQLIQNPCNKISIPSDFQTSANVQGGDPISVEHVNTTSSVQVPTMPAPLHLHHPILYPFLQVPFQLPGWGLLNQQGLLVPPTALGEQLSRRTEAVTTCLKTSDSNLLPRRDN
jgi:hypothetical protein